MVKTVEKKVVEVAHEPGVTYSLKESARHLKKSEATAKRYKNLLTKVWSNALDQVVDPKSGSLTQKGLDELSIISAYVSSGEPDKYELITFEKYAHLLANEPVHEPVQDAIKQRFEENSESFEVIAYEPTVADLRLDYTNSNFNLDSVRGGTLAIKGIDDVLAMVDQVIDGAEAAIGDDLKAQQVQLQKIESAAGELRGKRMALEISKRKHQARTQRLQAEIELAKEDFQSELGQLQQ